MVSTQVFETQLIAETAVPMPSSFLRYLEKRAEGVWEVVLVSNEFDRYNTRILPSGFVGSPATTSIFYNHGGVNTGATLKNVRVEKNYHTGDLVNGKPVILEEATVGEIHVPQTAEVLYRNNKGEIINGGSLYERMNKDQANKVSVGFNPIEAIVEYNEKTIIYDLRNKENMQTVRNLEKQGVKLTYSKWELPELSVLDINSGQSGSVSRRIRSNNNMDETTKIPDELEKETSNTSTTNPETTSEEVETDRVIAIEAEATSDTSEVPAESSEAEEDTSTDPVEELRGVITNLTERIMAMEEALAGKTVKEEEEREANKIRSLTAVGDDVPEKIVASTSVEQKRQLGTDEENAKEFTYSDMEAVVKNQKYRTI